jgi:manganese/zinc/iron transport system permease protein
VIQWEWMIDGWIVVIAILSACSCTLLGNYLVLRRLSLMGDAISHAVLPGLAIAFLFTGSRASPSMFLGAVIVGALTALFTQIITEHGKVEHGAAMGVVFSVLFALGLILIRQAADRVDLDPNCVLYGNLVHIPLEAIGEPASRWLGWIGIDASVPPAARRLAVVMIANLLFVLLFYKELRITSFDPELATSLGIRASVMHYALMVMVAITTVANFEAVGSILVIAMLIVPAVAAHLLTDRLGVMILLSLVLATLSAVGGHWIAVFGPGMFGAGVTMNTAATMTVVAGGFLLLAIVASPEYGLVSRGLSRMALASRIVRQDILGLAYRWHERNAGTPMSRRTLQAALHDGRRVRRALRGLRRRGLINLTRTPDGDAAIDLTADGLARAAEVVGSHRLWETFLAEHFALDEDHLHAPAERMEHYITPELQDDLREQLKETELDPQGKPIPPRSR